jgi:uncharacterized protein YbjT (DUF2867 family)
MPTTDSDTAAPAARRIASTSLTVVVHGATGAQGAPVARDLVEAGHRVRSAVRNPSAGGLPAGVEPVAADLLDTEALIQVYDGADAVLVQLPLDYSARAVLQAEAVLAALAKARVPRVVLNHNGALALNRGGLPFVDARMLLVRELANVVSTAVTIGPAGPYMENLSQPWLVARIRQHDQLAYALPAELPMPWVAVDDPAPVIVDLLTGDAPPPHLVVPGPQALTGEQIAAELSTALGRPIQWVTISPSEFGEMIAPYLGDETAAGITDFYTALADGPPPPAPDPDTVRPGTTTLREWASRQDWTAPR